MAGSPGMALHIAAFAQSLPERAESSFRLGRSKYAAGRQNTDSGHLPRPLRPYGERRGEEPASQSADEHSTVHQSDH